MRDFGVLGNLDAYAGVLRAHATEREYPFAMEQGDLLDIGDGMCIHFKGHHEFTSREDQDAFVANCRDNWVQDLEQSTLYQKLTMSV